MAKRNSTKQVDSEAVQGEGSHVVLRRVKVGAWRKLKERTAELKADNFAIDLETIQDHVIEWDWVDDDGKPLPLPSDGSIDDLDLTIEEKSFLIGAIFGPGE
jgi:hypothetical protein